MLIGFAENTATCPVAYSVWSMQTMKYIGLFRTAVACFVDGSAKSMNVYNQQGMCGVCRVPFSMQSMQNKFIVAMTNRVTYASQNEGLMEHNPFYEHILSFPGRHT